MSSNSITNTNVIVMQQQPQQPQQRNKKSKNTALQNKRGEFRFRGKQLFGTWPRCPLSKEELLAFLLTLGMVAAVICQEDHADEKEKKEKKAQRGGVIDLDFDNDKENHGTHLHCWAEFGKQIDTINPNYFDLRDSFNNNYHCHIEKAIHKADVIRYVIKDGDYICHNIDAKAFGSANKNKRAYIGKLLLEDGKSLNEVVEENKELIFSYCSLKRNGKEYEIDIAEKKQKQEARYLDFGDGPINKQRHYWLYGDSDSGKSYFINKIVNNWKSNSFELPPNNDYMGYYGQQILYYDEFKGQISMQFLNYLCDGNCKANVKGSSTTIGSKTLLIIGSNFAPDLCYKNMDVSAIGTLLNRFNMIRFSNTIGNDQTYYFKTVKNCSDKDNINIDKIKFEILIHETKLNETGALKTVSTLGKLIGITKMNKYLTFKYRTKANYDIVKTEITINGKYIKNYDLKSFYCTYHGKKINNNNFNNYLIFN